jgi:hypothetical protein
MRALIFLVLHHPDIPSFEVHLLVAREQKQARHFVGELFDLLSLGRNKVYFLEQNQHVTSPHAWQRIPAHNSSLLHTPSRRSDTYQAS